MFVGIIQILKTPSIPSEWSGSTHAVTLTQQAQNHLYFLIKCYNFAHHSLVLSLFLENFPCGFKSHGFHYLILYKWGWVFVEILWNTRVTVWLHTRLLNRVSSLHLHLRMYFHLAQHIMAEPVRFFFSPQDKVHCISIRTLPFSFSFLEFTKLNVSLTFLFTLKNLIYFVGIYKSPPLEFASSNFFFPQKKKTQKQYKSFLWALSYK